MGVYEMRNTFNNSVRAKLSHQEDTEGIFGARSCYF